MRSLFRRQFVLILFLATMTLFGAMTWAQETRDRSSRSRSTGQPTLVPPEPGEDLFEGAQPGGGRPDNQRPVDGPADSISLTVWVLTIGEAPEMPADEVNVDFADRLRNLPDRFESIDQVRELAGQLRVAGMLRKVREIRLTTLDDQPAQSQSGRNQPRIVATNISPHPRPRAARSPRPDPASPDAGPPAPTSEPSNESDSIITNSITYEQLGTVIELLPRIDSTGSVHVQFSYNSSDAEKAPEVTLSEVPGRKPLIADKVVTHQIHSTVRLSAGMAVIVQRDSTQTFEGNSPTSTTQLVILAASVEPAIE